MVTSDTPKPFDPFVVCQEKFDESELRVRPTDIHGGTALALTYIDARCVMDRLDKAFGPGNWSDSYEEGKNGSVICTITVFLERRMPDGTGKYVPMMVQLSKSDVGKESKQQDDGDKVKAAFSDAFKRAAVKFGVGRYLYANKGDRRPYDAKNKCWGASKSTKDTPPADGVSEAEYQELVALATDKGINHAAELLKIGVSSGRYLERVDYNKFMSDWRQL